MFAEKIQALRDMSRQLDAKQIKKLNIEQFENLLIALTDKGLMDDSEGSKSVAQAIDKLYNDLEDLLNEGEMDRQVVRGYVKSFQKLLDKVKEVYGLEPTDSIRNRYMALGMTFGTSLGVVFMTVVNPGMMSIGIGAGMAIGLAIGTQKEKEAKEAGKIF